MNVNPGGGYQGAGVNGRRGGGGGGGGQTHSSINLEPKRMSSIYPPGVHRSSYTRYRFRRRLNNL